MMVVYSLTPRQTSSVSLLMICSMVARYAAPISYNFLNLIHLGGNSKTTFEKVIIYMPFRIILTSFLCNIQICRFNSSSF
jgi:hypothetical protein